MHYRYTFDENIFEKIDTKEKAWVLGLIYSDGNVDNRGRTLTFHIHEKDEDIFHKVLTIFKADNKIFVDNRGYLYMRFCSKKMCEDLIKLGCMPAKSKIIEFPRYLEPQLIPHFVRGVFEGDGCLSKIGQTSIVGSEYLSKGISEWLNSIGVEHKYFKFKYSDCLYYVQMTKHLEAKKFLENIYKDSNENIRMNRKYLLYQELIPLLSRERPVKLNEEDVRKIRKMYDEGIRVCDIHRLYPHMCNSSIDNIAKRHSRKNIV